MRVPARWAKWGVLVEPELVAADASARLPRSWKRRRPVHRPSDSCTPKPARFPSQRSELGLAPRFHSTYFLGSPGPGSSSVRKRALVGTVHEPRFQVFHFRGNGF